MAPLPPGQGPYHSSSERRPRDPLPRPPQASCSGEFHPRAEVPCGVRLPGVHKPWSLCIKRCACGVQVSMRTDRPAAASPVVGQPEPGVCKLPSVGTWGPRPPPPQPLLGPGCPRDQSCLATLVWPLEGLRGVLGRAVGRPRASAPESGLSQGGTPQAGGKPLSRCRAPQTCLGHRGLCARPRGPHPDFSPACCYLPLP